jgi:predicted LPLAT superfamily acyltransferase
MTPARTPATEWTRRSERGSLPLIRFMVWFSLTMGRPVARGLLRLIALYFLVFGGKARRASREFLARALGRRPSWLDQYRLVFAFAATLHDRVYFLKGRFHLFDIRMHGTELFADGAGVLMMGAHVGSFEVLRACGRHLGHRRVAMAMYEDNARKINGVLSAIAPGAMADIVPLGHVESMLELGARLEDGALVGVLADRTLGHEPVIRVPFFGEAAPFPTGPMRMAAALRQRVVFMIGMYRGGNRYEVRFEPLADFRDLEGLSRTERDARVQEAVARYAQRLEHYGREAPYNWFNFHDFWGRQA